MTTTVEAIYDYQTAEVFVASHKDPTFLGSTGQQGSVRGAGQSEFSGSDDIVAEFAEETSGQRVNVQESHEAAPTWMSSL
jgi:hypothetical protein